MVMKKIILISLFLLTACQKPEPKVDNPEPTINPAATLSVAAFNVQIFGVSKMSKPLVVEQLKKIIQRYDLVLIQEIRDSSGAAILNLQTQVNQVSDRFDLVIGSRQGRSSSKEQYAYFYDRTKLQVVSQKDYNDSLDTFEREPFLVKFKFLATADEFFVLGIHTKPEDAKNELDYLKTVFNETATDFGTDNSIMMGDFNSDCTYLSDPEWTGLSFNNDSFFTPWFDKAGDSTVAPTTVCQYDQMVTTGRMTTVAVPGSNKIFNFLLNYGLTQSDAEDVSDHYPVEMQFQF